MKEITWVEGALTGIGKVDCVIRIHSNKDLNKPEDACKDTLVGVLLNLVIGLAHRDATPLELKVNNWHAVNEQTKVTTTVIKQLIFSAINWLLSYLIPAITCCYFLAVVNFETNLFAKVSGVVWVITFDADCFTVDERIERKRCSKGFDLLDNLSHLTIGQRLIV